MINPNLENHQQILILHDIRHPLVDMEEMSDDCLIELLRNYLHINGRKGVIKLLNSSNESKFNQNVSKDVVEDHEEGEVGNDFSDDDNGDDDDYDDDDITSSDDDEDIPQDVLAAPDLDELCLRIQSPINYDSLHRPPFDDVEKTM